MRAVHVGQRARLPELVDAQGDLADAQRGAQERQPRSATSASNGCWSIGFVDSRR